MRWYGATSQLVAGRSPRRIRIRNFAVTMLHLLLLCVVLVAAQCNNHGVPDGRICKCDAAFLPPFCQTEATRLVLEPSWPYELRWAVHSEQGTIDMAVMFGGHSCWAGLGTLSLCPIQPKTASISQDCGSLPKHPWLQLTLLWVRSGRERLLLSQPSIVLFVQDHKWDWGCGFLSSESFQPVQPSDPQRRRFLHCQLWFVVCDRVRD
jgi:hypothetical protein